MTIRERVASVLADASLQASETHDVWLACQRRYDLDERKRESYKSEIRKQRTTIEGEPDAGSDRYEILTDERIYRCTLRGEIIDLPFQVVDDLYLWYSQEGENLKRREVAARLYERHKIAISVRRLSSLMLHVLGLIKSSTTLPPHRLIEADPVEAGTQILERREAVARAHAERQADDRHRRLWRKELRSQAINSKALESLIKGALEAPRLPVPTYPLAVPAEGHQRASSWLLLASDWHAGQCFDHALGAYNRDVYWTRVQELAARVCATIAEDAGAIEEVVLAVGGDILDGVLPQRAQHQLQQDVHEGAQMRLAAEGLRLVVEALAQCTSLPVRVISVSGNHDRAGGSRNDDPNRVIGQALAMIASGLIDAEHTWHHASSDIVAPFRVGNHACLLTHGDRNKPPNLVDVYWPGEDVLVLGAHLHHFDVQTGARYQYVLNGSLPGAAPYETQCLGKGCRPVQALIRLDKRGRVFFPIVLP